MNQRIWLTWQSDDVDSIRAHADPESAEKYFNQLKQDSPSFTNIYLAFAEVGIDSEPTVVQDYYKPGPPIDPNSPAYKMMMDLYSTPSLAEISASSSFKDDVDLNCTDSVIYPELKNDDEK